ncbi:MAG: hypothetical protein HQL97_11970 [Magnetococcales bacterium]|nr:hypothetical protein [Magnetococcales bacterium]
MDYKNTVRLPVTPFPMRADLSKGKPVIAESRGMRWPAGLDREGSDQHQGGVHSPLPASVGGRNKLPCKALPPHGFVPRRQAVIATLNPTETP